MHPKTKQKLLEFYDYQIPNYVVKATKTYIVIKVGGDWRELQELKITMKDVADYYEFEAPNITSGIRTLAGFSDAWRGIDIIARECLEWFKFVNIKGLRRACTREGMKPIF